MIARRRGRPSTSRHRDIVATIRLNQDEKDILEELASNANLSVYAYVNRIIRDRINDYKEYVDEKNMYNDIW